MPRTLLSFCALSLFLAACSGGASPDATSLQSDSMSEDSGTLPMTVTAETAFCERFETAKGGACRVSSPSEPNPSAWTLCAEDPLAPLRPRLFYVPLASDAPLRFDKAKPDGTVDTLVTVQRAKYVACSRERGSNGKPGSGVRNLPRAEVYARRGTAHVSVERSNPSTEMAKAEGLVEYDNRAFAGQPPLLEAALLFQSKDGTWRESARIDLPNESTVASLEGFAPAGVNVRLEVRGGPHALGDAVATVLDAQLSLPGACKWDPSTRSCAF